MSRPTRIPFPARRLGALGAGLVLAVVVLAGCGGSGTSAGGATQTAAGSSTAGTSSAAGSASSTVGSDGTLVATEAEFSISLGTDTLAAGPYVVRVDNKGQATHNLFVERAGVKIAGTSNIDPGGSASLSVTLKPGTYVFYCSIGNHRAMGMEATVHVQ